MHNPERIYEYTHTPSLMVKTMFYYVQSIGHYRCAANDFYERDNFDNFLLLYTKRGSGKLVYRNQTYTLSENQIFIIDCMEYQSYGTAGENDWEFYFIHFNGCSSKHYVELIIKNIGVVITLKENSKIVENIDKIYGIFEAKDINIDIKNAKIIVDILTDLFLLNHDENELNYFPKIVQQVILKIENNFNEKVKIETLCKEIHISKNHLTKLFNKYTHSTPYEYLINFRINNAKNLLISTELSIGEIAEKVGFGNTSHFIKIFVKSEKTTPAKFREYMRIQ